MLPKIDQGILDIQTSELGREHDHDCLLQLLLAICCPCVEEFRQDHGFAGSWRTTDAAETVVTDALANFGDVLFDRQPSLVPSPWQACQLTQVRLFKMHVMSPERKHSVFREVAEISFLKSTLALSPEGDGFLVRNVWLSVAASE